MGLIIGIILLAWIYLTHLPATNGIREGREHLKRMRETSREHWRAEAVKQDRYYDPATGSMNPDFYGDGSLYRDMSTNKVYPKGQYYCDSNGMSANWKIVNNGMNRPAK